ncbi:hypothetical protein Hanom_Chr12g01107131 [Helianthus anomalus]
MYDCLFSSISPLSHCCCYFFWYIYLLNLFQCFILSIDGFLISFTSRTAVIVIEGVTTTTTGY